MIPPPLTATILGAPRIGPNRELTRAIEKYWSGTVNRAELESVASDLRHTSGAALAAIGLDRADDDGTASSYLIAAGSR
jgi:5-methyltetrahydropteroyltriglutamate--homocysteine methyltransferase